MSLSDLRAPSEFDDALVALAKGGAKIALEAR